MYVMSKYYDHIHVSITMYERLCTNKYLDVNNHPDTCSAFRPFYSVSVSLLSLEPPA